MCRNIRTLHNFEPPATEDEVRAAAREEEAAARDGEARALQAAEEAAAELARPEDA